MEDQTLRLKVANLCKWGAIPQPKHHFYGCDDNRYFKCAFCETTYSWAESKAMGHKEPPGPCPGSDENYPEDLNVIVDVVVQYVPEDLMREYIGFLVAEMGEGEYTVNASAKQRCNAFVKFKEKYP